MYYSEFHKKTRGQLPPVNLRETHPKPNATKIAIDMVTADQSLSVDQVIDSLKKNNVIQVYNTPTKKIDYMSNRNSTNKLQENVLNTQKTTDTNLLNN